MYLTILFAQVKLLMAADKYQVDTLKTLCTAATAKELDADHLSSLVMKIEWHELWRVTGYSRYQPYPFFP